MAATVPDVERVVRVIAETVVANERYFGDLDAVVGDGDFGYSMARGFEVVLSDWDGFDRSDVSTFLKKIAVVITSRIGGTSGPIWGTGFLRAATAAAGAQSVDTDQIVAMLRAAVEGIKARGGAELGEKTLLDALDPATVAIEKAAKDGATGADTRRAAAVAARSAAEGTRGMQARRGRASYTGERSIGTLDAGAVAVAVLLEAIADQWPAGTPDT
jgi:phosphoenolpyruvate---glycerone phosphotransferase subunit DhaL